MPQNEDRRDQDGRKEVWHHELGWISGEGREPEWEWGWSKEDDLQAQLDVADAEVKL
jgi:hypothetical protein